MNRRRRPLVRRLGIALLLLLLLAAAGGAGGLLWLRDSLPQTEGRLALPGLEAPVEVLRDADGIPTIRARTEADAYFALGVVHAQDRLWQMEVMRRAGQGRLAEMFGAAALDYDRYVRTFGLYRLAEASLRYLAPATRAALEAYAAGVNAWLDTSGRPLPPEFLLLGHRPEPWRPADSLVWGRLMAVQLSGNWLEELRRARVVARLGPERAAALWTGGGDGAASITAAGLDDAAAALLAEVPDPLRPHLASNAWVVSGTRTASGRPLLANDPHLGFKAPILWYLARVETPEWSVAGATAPGVPFHVIGHNGRIAWGITSTHSDTMDVFIEKLAPGGGYLTPRGPAPFAERREVIEVKDAAPQVLKVRATRHGPVVSDLVAHDSPPGTVLALAATLFEPDDRSAQGLYRLNRARDWQGFVAALRDFHSPQQNVMFAAADGTIGLVVPGRVPMRQDGDGTLPRPGWTGAHDWTGWLPFEALPRLRNPTGGIIVNANNRVVGDDYPHLLAAHWPESYRAERIAALLAAAPRHDAATMRRMQMDAVSPMAAEMLALLDAAPVPDGPAREALERLRRWDHDMRRDRPEPLIALAWLHRLQQRLLAPALGPLAEDMRMLNPRFLRHVLTAAPQWCEEAGAPCPALAAASLEEALAALREAGGADMDGWRWGDAHRAEFRHEVLAHVPLIGRLASLSAATDGGDFTVNRGSYDGGAPTAFRHVHGPGLRVVFDLAALEDSRFVIATGQSGNPLSRHYGDMLARWRDGGYVTLAPGDRRLLLEPAP